MLEVGGECHFFSKLAPHSPEILSGPTVECTGREASRIRNHLEGERELDFGARKISPLSAVWSVTSPLCAFCLSVFLSPLRHSGSLRGKISAKVLKLGGGE